MGKAREACGHDRRIGNQLRPFRRIIQQLLLKPAGDWQAAVVAGFRLSLLGHHFRNTKVPDHPVPMSFRQGAGQIGKGPLCERQALGRVVKTVKMVRKGQLRQIYPRIFGLQILFHFLDAGKI